MTRSTATYVAWQYGKRWVQRRAVAIAEAVNTPGMASARCARPRLRAQSRACRSTTLSTGVAARHVPGEPRTASAGGIVAAADVPLDSWIRHLRERLDRVREAVGGVAAAAAGAATSDGG